MPGAGTDSTRDWSAGRGPIVVLVEPQLGENIGAAARAMANFGLSQLRLVNPRQGWPNDKARMMATGAGRGLDAAGLFPTLPSAVARFRVVFPPPPPAPRPGQTPPRPGRSGWPGRTADRLGRKHRRPVRARAQWA